MPFLRKCNFLLVFLFFIFSGKSVLAEFTSGAGTSESPYEIDNCTQLQDIGSSNSSYFILAKNIDCSETSTWNLDVGGTYLGFVPISFYGNFNGQSYIISNLYINRIGETDVGLFGSVHGAVVKNFKLTGVNVAGNNRVGGAVGNIYSGGYATNISVGGTVTGINNVGGIIGVYNKNTVVDTTVENLTFNGSVIGLGDTSSQYIGGVVGTIEKNSSYTTKITFSNLSSFGTVDGGNASGIGGVIGYFTSDGVITNSYSESSIKGSWMVGGLMGANMEGQIENSYATGQVEGNDYVGGLLGALGGGVIKNSHATGKVTGKQVMLEDWWEQLKAVKLKIVMQPAM